MRLRKRVIAGIAAIFVILVGAFAQAMFSEGGFARGWDIIGSVLRPGGEQRPRRSVADRRFGGSVLPDRAPVHPMGDMNSVRVIPSVLSPEKLEELRSSSTEPMSFDLEGEVPEGEGAEGALGKVAEMVSRGGLGRTDRGRGRLGQPSDSGALTDRLFGAANTNSSPSLQSVALAAMGGGGGGMDPTQDLGGVLFSDAADTVATPVPPAAFLFISVWAAIMGRNHLRRV